MSNLGFSMGNNYTVSQTGRRRSRETNSTVEGAQRDSARAAPPQTPKGFYLGLVVALALASSFAFPDKAAMVLRHFGLM